MDYKDILTLEPGKRGGKPCIRGMRITVRGTEFPRYTRLSSGGRLVYARSHGGPWGITIRAGRR